MSKIQTQIIFFILPPKLITIVLLFYYFNYYFIIFLRRPILDPKIPLMDSTLSQSYAVQYNHDLHLENEEINFFP